ncbi:CHAT domain-containing tetratricopeptide repeat protein [Polyangium spumosum]|nr:CHAT domain-containing protein [Polyangium spumosum]
MRRLANAAFALTLALGTLSGGLARADTPAKPAAAVAEGDALEKEVESLYLAGKYAAALAAAQKLVALREQNLGKEHPKTGSALSDLGGMYLATGDYPKAEGFLRRAVEILEATKGQGDLLATALGNLATLLKKKGDMKGAERAYERAVALEEKGGAPREAALGTVLGNLAGLYMATGKLTQAEKLLLRAISLHDKPGLERSLVIDLANLGALYRGTGEHHKAADQYNRALPIAENLYGTMHPEVGRLYHNIAVFLASENQKDRAEAYYLKAEGILRKTLGPGHPSVADLYNDWAEAWVRRDMDRALALRMKGQDIDEKHLENALASGTEDDKLAYAAQLEETMRTALSFQWARGGRSLDTTRFVLRTVLRHKARVLESTAASMGALRERMSPEDRALLDELARVRGALASAIRRGPRGMTTEAFEKEVERLAKEADAIDAQITTRSVGFRRARKPVTIEAVAERIPEDAALVEFVRYTVKKLNHYSARGVNVRDEYLVYVLRRDGTLLHSQIYVPANVVDAKIARIRAGMQDPGDTKFYKELYLLQNLLLGRLLPHLKGVKHLLVAPDGDLALLPFGALLLDNGKFLLQEYAVTYLSSGRDLLRLGERDPKRSAPVLVASPDYDAPGDAGAAPLAEAPKGSLPLISRVKFTPLPGTAEEAAAVRPLLPSPRVQIDRIATETALKQVASPRILHVATHGFFLSEDGKAAQGRKRGFELEVPTQALPQIPAAGEATSRVRVTNPMLLSGIALAGANVRKGQIDDGILTAYEASALDLSGTELVVLSACETGIGDVDTVELEKGNRRFVREGVMGLRRALVLAGSETQVMSLWQVDDDATRDLMTAYYQKLFREGKGRSEAMREAQLMLFARPAQKHPFYWASFIVSGAWGPLEGVTAAKGPAPSAGRSAVPPGGARGCGCRVAGAQESTQAAWAGALFVLALAAARRARSG